MSLCFSHTSLCLSNSFTQGFNAYRQDWIQSIRHFLLCMGKKKKCTTFISVLAVQFTTENLAKGRIKIPGLQWSCIMSPCRQIIACKRLKQLGQTLGRPWEENPAIHYVLEVETYCRCCAAERGRDVNLGWMCISRNPHLVTLLWPGMVVYLLVARVLQWHYDFLFTLK